MPTLTLLRLTLLHRYCADGYADGLCKQSQALACAADLLEKHAFDSYEAHVALRTVRLGFAVWPELVRVRARTRLITVCVLPSD